MYLLASEMVAQLVRPPQFRITNSVVSTVHEIYFVNC